MTQSLEEFRQQVLQDPSLTEQFKAVSNSDEFINLAVQLGQQLGYSFTAEEVEAALAENSSSSMQELDDAELDKVAGGADTSYCFSPNTKYIANPN